jgi:hypothetical protein
MCFDVVVVRARRMCLDTVTVTAVLGVPAPAELKATT